MTGTINERFRQRLLIKFLKDNDIANVYLVFSEDDNRDFADVTSDISRVAITSLRDLVNGITPKYAIRLDTGNKLKFAIEPAEGIIGETISVDGTNYVTNNNIEDPNQLDELWTSAYFNAPIDKSAIETALEIVDEEDPLDFAKANYNIVSVVINLAATDETLSLFSSATFANAEIIMQNRPSIKNLLNIKDAQFPGLIRF